MICGLDWTVSSQAPEARAGRVPFNKSKLRLFRNNVLNHRLDLRKGLNDTGLDSSLDAALDVLTTCNVLSPIELFEHFCG